MTEGIHITRARLHELLTDAHVALVEHRETQAGAIINALRKITAPEHPATAPLPLLMQIMPQQHLTAEPGSRGTPAVVSRPTDGAPVAPAPSPAQAAGERTVRAIHRRPGGFGKPILVWVPARDDLLRAEFPTCTDSEGLFARLNAIPAPEPVASLDAMGQRAIKLGIKRTPETLRAVMRGAALRGLERANASRLASLGGTPTRGISGIASALQEAALQDLWPTDATVAAIMVRLSEIDGPTISAKSTIYRMARALGLPVPRPVAAASVIEAARQAVAAPVAPQSDEDAAQPEIPAEVAPPPAPPKPTAPEEPSPEEQAAIADAAVASKQERVKQSLREMLARKVKDDFLSASQIATRHGMPTREVMRLLGEVRRERQAA